MTDNEQELQNLNDQYDKSVNKFNLGHSKLKHLKQANYQLLKKIEALTKVVRAERAAEKGLGPLAD